MIIYKKKILTLVLIAVYSSTSIAYAAPRSESALRPASYTNRYDEEPQERYIWGYINSSGHFVKSEFRLAVEKFLGNKDLVETQRRPKDDEKAQKEAEELAKAALKTIAKKAAEYLKAAKKKTFSELTQEEFNKLFGARQIVVAGGLASRFSPLGILPKAIAQAGTGDTNLRIAANASRILPEIKLVVVVGKEILQKMLKEPTKEIEYGLVDDKEIDPAKKAQLIPSDAILVATPPYGHGITFIKGVEALKKLGLDKETAFYQIVFGEMSTAADENLSNAGFITYLKAVAGDCIITAGGRKSKEVKKKGNFIITNDRLSALIDWDCLTPYEKDKLLVIEDKLKNWDTISETEKKALRRQCPVITEDGYILINSNTVVFRNDISAFFKDYLQDEKLKQKKDPKTGMQASLAWDFMGLVSEKWLRYHISEAWPLSFVNVGNAPASIKDINRHNRFIDKRQNQLKERLAAIEGVKTSSDLHPTIYLGKNADFDLLRLPELFSEDVILSGSIHLTPDTKIGKGWQVRNCVLINAVLEPHSGEETSIIENCIIINSSVSSKIRHLKDRVIRDEAVPAEANEGLIALLKAKGIIDTTGKSTDEIETEIENILVPTPANAASKEQTGAIFTRDYIPGMFTHDEIKGLPAWDNYRKYLLEQVLKNELEEIDREDALKEAQRAVVLAMDFVLTRTGRQIREKLTNNELLNLTRIMMKIVLFGRPDVPDFNPWEKTNALANKIALESQDDNLTALERLKGAIGAGVVDFNNPRMHEKYQKAGIGFIKKEFAKARSRALAIDFWQEYEKEVLKSEKPITVVYLADNNGEAVFDLSFIQTQLEINPNLKICLVPKSKQVSNDASYTDVNKILQEPLFANLREMKEAGRFIVIKDGPQIQGIDGRKISKELANALEKADVVFTKGQANFEMTQGIKKPLYNAFIVKGMGTQTATGIDSKRGAYVFLRVNPGDKAFRNYSACGTKTYTDPTTGNTFGIAGTTVSEYADIIRNSIERKIPPGVTTPLIELKPAIESKRLKDLLFNFADIAKRAGISIKGQPYILRDYVEPALLLRPEEEFSERDLVSIFGKKIGSDRIIDQVYLLGKIILAPSAKIGNGTYLESASLYDKSYVGDGWGLKGTTATNTVFADNELKSKDGIVFYEQPKDGLMNSLAGAANCDLENCYIGAGVSLENITARNTVIPEGRRIKTGAVVEGLMDEERILAYNLSRGNLANAVKIAIDALSKEDNVGRYTSLATAFSILLSENNLVKVFWTLESLKSSLPKDYGILVDRIKALSNFTGPSIVGVEDITSPNYVSLVHILHDSIDEANRLVNAIAIREGKSFKDVLKGQIGLEQLKIWTPEFVQEHRQKNPSEVLLIGGGGGVGTWIRALIPLGWRISAIVTPFDDAGHTQQLEREVKEAWGYYTFGEGDKANTTTKFISAGKQQVLDTRLPKEYEGNLEAALIDVIKSAIVDPIDPSNNIKDDDDFIYFCINMLTLAREMDNRLINAHKVSLEKASIRNLIDFASLVYAGAYNEKEINRDLIDVGIYVLGRVLNIEKGHVVPASLDERKVRIDIEVDGKPESIINIGAAREKIKQYVEAKRAVYVKNIELVDPGQYTPLAPTAYKSAVNAIAASIGPIVIGPGNFNDSIIPIFHINDIILVLKQRRQEGLPVVFVVNSADTVTSVNYQLNDFISRLEQTASKAAGSKIKLEELCSHIVINQYNDGATAPRTKELLCGGGYQEGYRKSYGPVKVNEGQIAGLKKRGLAVIRGSFIRSDKQRERKPGGVSFVDVPSHDAAMLRVTIDNIRDNYMARQFEAWLRKNNLIRGPPSYWTKFYSQFYIPDQSHGLKDALDLLIKIEEAGNFNVIIKDLSKNSPVYKLLSGMIEAGKDNFTLAFTIITETGVKELPNDLLDALGKQYNLSEEDKIALAKSFSKHRKDFEENKSRLGIVRIEGDFYITKYGGRIHKSVDVSEYKDGGFRWESLEEGNVSAIVSPFLTEDFNEEERSVISIMLENKYDAIERSIPEFSAIISLPQRHLYLGDRENTVERHVFTSLAKLQDLINTRRCFGIKIPELEPNKHDRLGSLNIKTIWLAVLLHDIAKYYIHNHPDKGAKITKAILWRLGITPRDIRIVELLVKYHGVFWQIYDGKANIVRLKDVAADIALSHFVKGETKDGFKIHEASDFIDLLLYFEITEAISSLDEKAAISRAKLRAYLDYYKKLRSVLDGIRTLSERIRVKEDIEEDLGAIQKKIKLYQDKEIAIAGGAEKFTKMRIMKLFAENAGSHAVENTFGGLADEDKNVLVDYFTANTTFEYPEQLKGTSSLNLLLVFANLFKINPALFSSVSFDYAAIEANKDKFGLAIENLDTRSLKEQYEYFARTLSDGKDIYLGPICLQLRGGFLEVKIAKNNNNANPKIAAAQGPKLPSLINLKNLKNNKKAVILKLVASLSGKARFRYEIYYEDKEAGYIKFNIDRKGDSLGIESIYIYNEFVNQGIGTTVLNWCITMAKQNSLRVIAGIDNPKMIHMIKKDNLLKDIVVYDYRTKRYVPIDKIDLFNTEYTIIDDNNSNVAEFSIISGQIKGKDTFNIVFHNRRHGAKETTKRGRLKIIDTKYGKRVIMVNDVTGEPIEDVIMYRKYVFIKAAPNPIPINNDIIKARGTGLYEQIGIDGYNSEYYEYLRNCEGLEELKKLVKSISKPRTRLIPFFEEDKNRIKAEVDLRRAADQKELEILTDILVSILNNKHHGEVFKRYIRNLASSEDVSNMFKIAIRLAESKIFVNSIKQKTKIGVTFAVYTCKDRMSKRTEDPNGEDALRVKIWQLENLFKDNPLVDWQLLVVDDGSPNQSGEFAENIIRQEYPEYYRQGKVKVKYLQNEIEANLTLPELMHDPILRDLRSSDDSQKGGSIIYGMNELIREGCDYAVFTDTDVSSHLGLIGILLRPMIEEGFGAAIGSREMPDSLVLNRPLTRKIRAWQDTIYYNKFVIRRTLPQIEHIRDTQNGFKAFSRGMLSKILAATFEKGLVFDTELLLLTQMAGYRIKEVGMPWVDPPERTSVSIKAGIKMAKRMQNQKKRVKSGEYERLLKMQINKSEFDKQMAVSSAA